VRPFLFSPHLTTPLLITGAGGKDCKYRHALPQGFILKKDMVKDDEEEITMEQLIETERQALLKSVLPGDTLTKVTEETFKAWKRNKILQKKRKAARDSKKKGQRVAAGAVSGLNGRELFQMGHTDEVETKGGAGGGAKDDFDIGAMKKAANDLMIAALTEQGAEANLAADAAAAAAKGESGGGGGAAAPATRPEPTSKAVDNIFDMDLGDLEIDMDDLGESDDEEDMAAQRTKMLAAAKAAELTAVEKTVRTGVQVDLLGGGADDSEPVTGFDARREYYAPGSNLETVEDAGEAGRDDAGAAAGAGAAAVTVDTALFDGEDLDGIDLEGLEDED
jgi:hypothetical protein